MKDITSKDKRTLAAAVILLAVIVIAGVWVAAKSFSSGKSNETKAVEKEIKEEKEKKETTSDKEKDPTKDYADTIYGKEINPESESFAKGHEFKVTEETVTMPELIIGQTPEGYPTKEDPETGILSSNVVLVDLDEGTIVAQRHADEIIVPASMTKVLTLLVATRNIKDLDDTYALTIEDADYCYANECSVVGFEVGEQVPIKDCVYGTIAVSGADAVLGLCNTVAGSHEAFVDMMNDELKELGLSDTAHFTNAVGLFADDHYCTVTDLAVITKEALYSQLCRDALGTRECYTTPTEQHPEGMWMYNQFIGRIEDIPMPGICAGAKTGYVDESGNCAISYFISNSDKHYICVTAKTPSKYQCSNDHAAIYNLYAK